jgi:prevent-host-death family protein
VGVETLKAIAAEAFKAPCLAIMDDVRDSTIGVIITKNGKPIAQLVPVEEVQDSLFCFYAGKLVISGDIESSSVPPERW